jgi:hypothetical protein
MENIENIKGIYAQLSDILDNEITLRDQFAMAALTGVVASSKFSTRETEDSASFCYEIADAMLEARKK